MAYLEHMKEIKKTVENKNQALSEDQIIAQMDYKKDVGLQSEQITTADAPVSQQNLLENFDNKKALGVYQNDLDCSGYNISVHDTEENKYCLSAYRHNS